VNNVIDNIELELTEKLRGLTLSAMFSIESANEVIFKDFENKETRCLVYLYRAINYISDAKMLYLMNQVLWRDDIDSFFSQFNVFIDEITRNIATNHSHQWTDIEFKKLAEIYDFSSINCEYHRFSQ